MATYKVIQDIEAEDHILGPLSLRQFIYALVAAFCFYLSFLSVTKLHAPFLLVLFLPPALFCGFFAIPFGRDQSTEVWALAKLRFWFKPRKRIWNQSGVKELVTITVPKKIEVALTDGLSQTEVKSRLQALANTLDSRGWAVKGVGADAYMQPAIVAVGSQQASDRLLDLNTVPQAVPDDDMRDNDVFDENTSVVSQQFDQMIAQSTQEHHQRILAEMAAASSTNAAPAAAQPPSYSEAPPADADYWFMSDQPDRPAAQASLPAAAPAPVTPDEEALAAQIRARAKKSSVSTARMHTLKPSVGAPTTSTPNEARARATAKPAAGATAVEPAILSSAKNNSVPAKRSSQQDDRDKEPPQDEVVVSLR